METILFTSFFSFQVNTSQQEHPVRKDSSSSPEKIKYLDRLIPAMAMAKTGSISTHESGVDVIVEWRIQHFSTLQEDDGALYISPEFLFGGEWWFLQIAPNGWSLRNSSGHVDLWLLKYSSGRSFGHSFSLSLKSVEGKKHNEQHGTKVFDNDNWNHIFNRFISRAELARRKSELLPDDVLTVVCTMKRSTSAGRDRNDPRHANVRASSQRLRASTRRVRASTQRVRASTQTVEVSTQTMEVTTRTVEASTQTVEVSTQNVEVTTQTVEVSTQTVEEKREASASGSSVCSHDEELHQDFKQLFLNNEDCDLIIKVKGSEFPAHRAILKARSPVFASTFRHNMKENATGIVEIDDCDPSTFSDFLCYLYCGDATLISRENAFGLFTAADKYQVSNLRAKCLEFVKENLSVDTFCETLTLALRHSEAELIRLCTDYFKQNVPRIIVTVKWQTFLAENPTEGNELFVKSFVPNSS